MWKDPIVDEIRKAREELADQCSFDPEKVSVFLFDLQSRSERKTVSLHMLEEIRDNACQKLREIP